MSAQANLAVADKYNAMSELVARISGEYSLENTRLAGRNAINTANVQAQAASALSAQGHLQNLDYAQKFPNNPYQLLESLAGMITGDSGLGGSQRGFDILRDLLFSNNSQSAPVRGPGRGGGGRD